MDAFEKAQHLRLVAGLGVVFLYLLYVVFVYWFTDAYPAAHLDRLYVFVLSFVIISYTLNENRRSKIVGFAHDLGFFAYLTFPIFIPYYLIKSRRKIGALILSGLVCLFLLEPIVYLIWSELA